MGDLPDIELSGYGNIWHLYHPMLYDTGEVVRHKDGFVPQSYELLTSVREGVTMAFSLMKEPALSTCRFCVHDNDREEWIYLHDEFEAIEFILRNS
jgi:hypothetical protein